MNNVLRISGYELLIEDVVRAQGCYLWDSKGRCCIDFEAGVWCAGLGHNHPDIVNEIRACRVTHVGYQYTNKVVEEAAAEALRVVGFDDGFFVALSSGSEAVELSILMARRLSDKKKLLTLKGSYLGAYGLAGLAVTGCDRIDPWIRVKWDVCKECNKKKCDPSCSILGDVPFENICAMVFEPGNSGGRVMLPPKKLILTLAHEVRKKSDGLVIIDEVTTGMGRTGLWFGFQHYMDRQAQDPDIVVMGKGLGNGYPVSAVVVSKEVAERLDEVKFRYAQSHQNDPLACVVAKKVMAVIEEKDLVDRSKRVGADFVEGLEDIGGRREDVVREVRGRGLMIAMELDDAHDFAAEVHKKLLKRGCLVGYRPETNILRFYPPLTIARSDIKYLLENLDLALAHVEKKPC